LFLRLTVVALVFEAMALSPVGSRVLALVPPACQ
jgi:hypothetical protein